MPVLILLRRAVSPVRYYLALAPAILVSAHSQVDPSLLPLVLQHIVAVCVGAHCMWPHSLEVAPVSAAPVVSSHT
jgi:hypothetical protein